MDEAHTHKRSEADRRGVRPGPPALEAPVTARSGTYVGPVERLRGKTALIIDHPEERLVRVQFDDLELGSHLTHGWREYAREDWDIEETEE